MRKHRRISPELTELRLNIQPSHKLPWTPIQLVVYNGNQLLQSYPTEVATLARSSAWA